MRGLHGARSKFCKDSAEETKLRGEEGYGDKCKHALLKKHTGEQDKSLEGDANAQVCQSKSKTEQIVLQDHAWFSEIVHEQRTASHFMFRCTECACYWRKT